MISSMEELLEHIGGWRVGCECHLEVKYLVERAERQGLVGRRLHYAPAHPTEGDEAFEVTDDGLNKMLDDDRWHAEEMRSWYRKYTSKPLTNLKG